MIFLPLESRPGLTARHPKTMFVHSDSLTLCSTLRQLFERNMGCRTLCRRGGLRRRATPGSKRVAYDECVEESFC